MPVPIPTSRTSRPGLASRIAPTMAAGYGGRVRWPARCRLAAQGHCRRDACQLATPSSSAASSAASVEIPGKRYPRLARSSAQGRAEAAVVMTLPGVIRLAVACWQMLTHGSPAPSAPVLMAAAAILLTGTALILVARLARLAGAFTRMPLALHVSPRRPDPSGLVQGRQFRPNAAGRSRPRAPAPGTAAA